MIDSRFSILKSDSYVRFVLKFERTSMISPLFAIYRIHTKRCLEKIIYSFFKSFFIGLWSVLLTLMLEAGESLFSVFPSQSRRVWPMHTRIVFQLQFVLLFIEEKVLKDTRIVRVGCHFRSSRGIWTCDSQRAMRCPMIANLKEVIHLTESRNFRVGMF